MGSWGHHVGVAFNALMSRGTGGRSSARRELGLRKGSRDVVSSLDVVSRVQDPDESLRRCGVLQRRRSYVLDQQQDMGSRACAFRDSFFEERGHIQGWLRAFLKKTFEFEDLISVAAKAALQQIKCAVRTAQNGVEKYRNNKGKQSLFWRRHVVASLRRRRKGGGRTPMCLVLGEELWSWYVDRLHRRPGRIGTQQLVDQAVVIATDLQDDWSIRVAQGQAEGTSFPMLPVLSPDWAGRWRKAYGVTFRTVNIRYKLSQSKRLHRLRIFWSNVLRMRLLHECLYGRDGIDFVSADQKPLYFNSSLASKSLAPRGANKVNVKESVADSRERFTLMTSCPSWQVTEPPGLAICFRHAGLEAKGVTRSVLPRRGGLVQWAPKGSHRLAQVLQYLKWAIVDGHGIPQKPVSTVVPCDDPEARARARAAAGSLSEVRHLVVVLDWFAPHLDERVDEELEAHDAACLRIAGGLTGDVQVCDTHRHGPLTSKYRTLEGRDAQTQMRLRPSKMPSFSRQHVWDRSLQAWAETSTGVEGRLEWVQNACVNALDGTEDGKIGQDILSIWTHLGMSAIRDQLREEIRDEVQAGRLHSFWQLHDSLESYDEHLA